MTIYKIAGELVNVFGQRVNYCKADIVGSVELSRWLTFFTQSAFFSEYRLNVSAFINETWHELEHIEGGYHGT